MKMQANCEYASKLQTNWKQSESKLQANCEQTAVKCKQTVSIGPSVQPLYDFALILMCYPYKTFKRSKAFSRLRKIILNFAFSTR